MSHRRNVLRTPYVSARDADRKEQEQRRAAELVQSAFQASGETT